MTINKLEKNKMKKNFTMEDNKKEVKCANMKHERAKYAVIKHDKKPSEKTKEKL